MHEAPISPPTLMDECRLSASLLTRLPIGGSRILPPGTLGRSVWAFPLVGAVVGLIAGLAALLAHLLGLGPWGVAVVAIAVELYATGALHEDGLGDMADGLGGGRDREARLRIMRDSRIGTYAAVCLWALLSGRLVALGEVGQAGGIWAMFWALIATNAAARAAILLPLVLLPPARADGLGASVGDVDAERAWIGAAIAFGIGVIALGWGVLVMGLASIAGGLAVVWLAHRHLAGRTGDVLGAAASAALVASLLAVAARG